MCQTAHPSLLRASTDCAYQLWSSMLPDIFFIIVSVWTNLNTAKTIRTSLGVLRINNNDLWYHKHVVMMMASQIRLNNTVLKSESKHIEVGIQVSKTECGKLSLSQSTCFHNQKHIWDLLIAIYHCRNTKVMVDSLYQRFRYKQWQATGQDHSWCWSK